MSSLPPDIETYVQEKIASGEFSSREEFFLESARIYRQLEQQQTALRSKLKERIEQAESGGVESLDVEAIKAEGRRQLADQD